MAFTDAQREAFRSEYFKGFTDEQFELAMAECELRNLVPGTHVVYQLRSAKEWVPEMNTSINVKKMTKVTTVDAFRLIANRTGKYEGQGDAEFIYLDEKGSPTDVSTIPLPDPNKPTLPREPWAVRVPIYRQGFREPVRVPCRFDAYAVTRKDKTGNLVLTDMWARRGPEQLAKCSTVAGLRAAFPEELGQMYIAEEFEREDSLNAPAPAETAEETKPVAAAPVAPTVPTVDHTPAKPVEAPRPNETEERKPRTRKQSVTEQPVEPATPVGATDEDLPESMFDKEESVQKIDTPAPEPEADRLLTKEEAKDVQVRVRSYYECGLTTEQIKQFALRTAGKDKPGDITKNQWENIFTKMDEVKSDKQKLIDLVTF